MVLKGDWPHSERRSGESEPYPQPVPVPVPRSVTTTPRTGARPCKTRKRTYFITGVSKFFVAIKRSITCREIPPGSVTVILDRPAP